MNDQDKEAFEQHINVVCNKENDYQRFYAIWQSACEYKQKEINELEKEKDYLCKKMENMRDLYKHSKKILQAENAKLRGCVEFYADKEGQAWAACQGTDTKDTCCHMVAESSGGKRARQVLKELSENK